MTPLLRRLRQRRGFTLIELLVVVVIIGILGSISMQNFARAQDKSRNSGLASNLRTVNVGLENYSSDNQGHYPSPGAEFSPAPAGLIGNKAMPGDRVPRSPWSNTNQTNSLNAAAATLPFVRAVTYMAGQPSPLPSCPQQVAATGVSPLTPTYTTANYGAIVYDLDTSSQVYVLYGIGKDHKRAIMSCNRSNYGD